MNSYAIYKITTSQKRGKNAKGLWQTDRLKSISHAHTHTGHTL